MNSIWFIVLYVLLDCLSMKCYGQTSCSVQDALQLNNDGVFISGTGSGRVEICVCTNNSLCFWQTVSTGSLTEPISWKNSIVICRQLGYNDVQSPILQSSVQSANHASSSVDIYHTTFLCDGSESRLIECDIGIATSSLDHEYDAYVNCQTTSVVQKVRLSGGRSTIDNRGIVEYYASNTWNTICPDFWTDSDANIVCVSLGYESGSSTRYTVNANNSDNIRTSPTIQSVNCDEDEDYFSSCTRIFSSSCASQTLAGAICQTDTGAVEGSTRLYTTESVTIYQRVEVYYNGRWGTVCDSQWNIQEGQVVCRDIGSDVSLTTVPTNSISFNSVSSRPIWIISYNCDGDESRLSSCSRPQFPIGYVSSVCTHSTDAGVMCDVVTTDSTGSSGGLSSGAIVGIVIGSICGFLFLGFFFGGWGKKNSRRRQAQAAARQRTQVQTVVALSTPTTVVVPQQNTTPKTVPAQPVNPTISQAPPPAYNEAIHQPTVKPPPQYPDEEKQLPYPPQQLFNPAYPPSASAPGPPGPNMYQGYPPPTQPGPDYGQPPVNPYTPYPYPVSTNGPYPAY